MGAIAQARQVKRARRETRRLRLFLGRVIRDLRRKCPRPAPALKALLERSERILRRQRHDSPKLYSVHPPEVECIAKGKAHTPYEFGCKVAIVTTSRSKWVVGVEAAHENPYDGRTLGPAIAQVERTTEVRPVEAFVDDNPDITEVLAAVLRHAGYVVSTAHSAPDALEAALSRHFDVVVSDIGMPGMTGHELARVLRSMPQYRSIPLVAVTGFDMYDDEESSAAAGFSAHLRKPIDPACLTRAVSGIWH